MLNLQTCSISPQFHVVFDDYFSTVDLVEENKYLSSFWNELQFDEHVMCIPLDDNALKLVNEWLTPDEVEDNIRLQTRADRFRSSFRHSSSKLTASPTINTHTTISPTSMPVPTNTSTHVHTNTNNFADEFQTVIPSLTDNVNNILLNVSTIPHNYISHSPLNSNIQPSVSLTSPCFLPMSTSISNSRGKRSCTTRGTRQRVKFVNEYSLSHVNAFYSNYQKEQLAHLASLTTNLTSSDVKYADPRCYSASLNLKDSDIPSYHEAIHEPHCEEYIQAMETEVFRQFYKIH